MKVPSSIAESTGPTKTRSEAGGVALAAADAAVDGYGTIAPDKAASVIEATTEDEEAAPETGIC
jgi:hypothetical protein